MTNLSVVYDFEGSLKIVLILIVSFKFKLLTIGDDIEYLWRENFKWLKENLGLLMCNYF